jgi:endo-1,4-beta-xylanase
LTSIDASALTRRKILAGAAAVIAPSSFAIALDSTATLASVAATKGITFGSQIASEHFSGPYLGLYRGGTVQIVTPENDLKMVRVRPKPDRYNFDGADHVVGFAWEYNIDIHGHNLLWAAARYNPLWVQEMACQRIPGFIDEYIATVVGRYRGRIVSWDVVNEPIGLGAQNVYQTGPYFDAMGPDYIARAFRAARAADQSATLVLNEGYTERDDDIGVARRQNLLTCLDMLLDAAAPIQAVGLQGHLKPQLPFSPSAFDRFLNEIERRDLDIYISELDVDDASFPDDIAQRDERVAAAYYRHLSIVLKHPRVKRVMTWGLADPYSYYVALAKRENPNATRLPRPLLLDDNFAPKPAWFAVERALSEAPVRG